jgi:NAD-dependent deacetylase
MNPHELLSEAARKICVSEKILILTGAGISAESGVPTFRAGDNVWQGMPFQELSSAKMVNDNLPLVWEWFDYRRGVVARCSPNAAHVAIAEAEHSGRFVEFTLVTQNVDGLHRDAGSKDLIELHGHINTARCLSCQELISVLEIPSEERPPTCPSCDDSMRPHVVLFGENLDEDDLNSAFEKAETCDVCVVIGTSSVVYPASSIPQIAKRSGAFCIEVNPQETDLSGMFDICLRMNAVESIPKLFGRVEGEE